MTERVGLRRIGIVSALVVLSACSAEVPAPVAPDVVAGPLFDATLVGTPPLFKAYGFAETTLIGTFEHPTGTSHTIRVALDMVDYRNGTSHKAWLKPEDYRIDRGTWTGLLNCPAIAGPGLKGVSAGASPTITCTWKAGYGSAPSGTVQLTPGTPKLMPPEPLFKAMRFGRTTLRGSFTWNGVEYAYSVLTDMADYRNGSSHKAWLKPEDYKLTSADEFPGAVSCPAVAGAGVKLVAAGRSPVVSCTWKWPSAGCGGNTTPVSTWAGPRWRTGRPRQKPPPDMRFLTGKWPASAILPRSRFR